ncbi:hypothetical protein [Actinomyces wuliandei]|uniref:hypothetical protein n=1 Tax=Actinomyces wuliandei TaxID=2057743 RepID=UPI000FDA592C|nr:hypothetical protein [Actinomyces wuliandei]
MTEAQSSNLKPADRLYLVDLGRRLDDAQAECQRATTAVLNDVDACDEVCARVLHARGYFRVPTMMCAWLDEDTTTRLAPALAMHIFGMKLMDDTIDGDTPLSRTELVCASVALCQRATTLLARSAPSAVELLRDLEESLLTVCRQMVAGGRKPPDSVAEWAEAALGFGGDFLAMYGRLACVAGGRPAAAASAAAAGRALGILIAMSDDWADYEKHHERVGNLRYIVGDDDERRAELLALARKCAREGIDAASAQDPDIDLAPVIRWHLDDLASTVDGLGPVYLR